MDALIIILLVLCLVEVIVAYLAEEKRHKLTMETIDENLKLIRKLSRIETTLLIADTTKEHYFTTIEKIKKELRKED